MTLPIIIDAVVEESNQQIEAVVVENHVEIPAEVDAVIVASTTEEYDGPYSVTPSEQAQTLEVADKKMMQDVSVDAIPSNYVGSEVQRQGARTVTPTESEQTAVPANRYTTGDVKVGAIPAGYVGSGVTRRTSADLSASGPTVTAPAGYYEESVSADVDSGRARTPNATITATPTVTVDENGLVTATVNKSRSITPTVTAGYVSEGVAGTITASGEKTLQLDTQAGATITPTESAQTAVGAHKYTVGEVTVDVVPSDYVGSAVPRKTSADLTKDGKTVTAPAGFYAESASKDVDTGNRGNGVNVISNSSTKKTITVTHPDATSGWYNGSQLKTDGVVELTFQDETVTPSEEQQTVAPTGSLYYIRSVVVDAIPTDYGKIEQDGAVLTIS